MLDLYLFNGVHERSTRHFADDLQSFDEDRGTRDGLDSSKKVAQPTVDPEVVINSLDYEFDEKEGKMRMIIR